MYTNRFYCSCLDYVKDNLNRNEIVEYVELPKDKLPEPIYEDDPKRYWEIWKKKRGYKLYTVESIIECKPKVLTDNNSITEGMVRLYRTAPKELMQSKPKPKPVSKDQPEAPQEQNTVPCEVAVEG